MTDEYAADAGLTEMRHGDYGDDMAWLASDDGHSLASDVDAELMRQLESMGRERRSRNDLHDKVDQKQDVDINRRQDNQGKRRRRPPVDPTLLMMGIGKRR